MVRATCLGEGKTWIYAPYRRGGVTVCDSGSMEEHKPEARFHKVIGHWVQLRFGSSYGDTYVFDTDVSGNSGSSMNSASYFQLNLLKL